MTTATPTEPEDWPEPADEPDAEPDHGDETPE
jgi:hypothetical protein